MILKICFSGSNNISLDFLYYLFFNKFYFSFLLISCDKLYNNKIYFNNLKIFCLKYNLFFFQFNNLLYLYNKLNIYNFYFFDKIKSIKFKIFIILNYGFFFSKNILLFSKFKFWNIHFSLLPLYKGKFPIQYSLVNFNNFSGFSFIFVENNIDLGKKFFFFKFYIKYFFLFKIVNYKICILIVLLFYKLLLIMLKNNLFFFNQSSYNSFYSIF